MLFHEILMHKRHKELLAEAERARLIQKAKRRPVKTSPFYARYLARLGGILCNLGSRLEKSFTEEVAMSHSQSTGRSLKV